MIPIVLLGGLLLAWVLPFMSVSGFFIGEDYAVRLLGGELSVFSLDNELDAGWVPWLSLIGMLAAAAAAFFMERSPGRSAVVTLGRWSASSCR